MTSVTIDQAGNVWAVDDGEPDFGTGFEPKHGDTLLPDIGFS